MARKKQLRPFSLYRWSTKAGRAGQFQQDHGNDLAGCLSRHRSCDALTKEGAVFTLSSRGRQQNPF
eukprot:1138386-Pelagomonas_calceolata.AAC.11